MFRMEVLCGSGCINKAFKWLSFIIRFTTVFNPKIKNWLWFVWHAKYILLLCQRNKVCDIYLSSRAHLVNSLRNFSFSFLKIFHHYVFSRTNIIGIVYNEVCRTLQVKQCLKCCGSNNYLIIGLFVHFNEDHHVFLCRITNFSLFFKGLLLGLWFFYELDQLVQNTILK